MIGLLIVDDHPVVRDGLRGMFAGDDRFEVLGEAGNGREALAVARSVNPDVVLMDLRMPEMDGVTTIRALRDQGSTARVLVLTTYDTDTDILHAVEAGAAGYLLKDTPHAELLNGIRAAARGETVLAPPVAARLMSRLRTPAAPAAAQPSPRELEVLAAVARGLSNAEIGRELFIGEATVKTHLQRLFAKLDVDDRTRAVTTAIERGLLPSPGH